MAQTVKNLPAVWENQVKFLDQEDPLEKKMATHSSILAWEIPWTEEPGGLQSTGHKELNSTEQLSLWLVAHNPVHVGVFMISSVQSFSCVRLFTTSSTVAPQAPLSMGFSKQEYWNGLPFPSPGDLPDPGIEPGSPALQADSLLTELGAKPDTVLRPS